MVMVVNGVGGDVGLPVGDNVYASVDNDLGSKCQLVTCIVEQERGLGTGL